MDKNINVLRRLKTKSCFVAISFTVLLSLSHNSLANLPQSCVEHCKEIKDIGFLMVDKTNKNIISRKSIFVDKINYVLSTNSASDRIKVIVLKLDHSLSVYQPMKGSILIDISFYNEVHDSSLVDFDLKVIAPDKVYFEHVTCKVSKDFSCIDAEFDTLVEKFVNVYLFKYRTPEIKH